MKSLESKSCPQFRANFTVSDQDTKVLREFCEGTFCTIPNGVDTDSIAFQPFNRTEITKIGWLGGLHWNPNKEAVNWFLREVWPSVSELYLQVELHLAGSGTELEVNDDENITAHGYLADIKDYMQSLDLFIVPLLTGGGTRLKILDAFARGTPVISTSKGAEGILVEHGKNILIADSREDFLNLFSGLMNSKFDLNKISKNARVLVEENYNWQNIALKMANAITGNESTG